MAPPETRLTVAVRPRAGRDDIAGWDGCAPSRVEIVRGRTGRTKIVRIAGLAPADAAARLDKPGAAALRSR